MANIAHTINCLHSLVLAHETRYVRTPTYYVFELYRGHMGAYVVPLQIHVEDLTVSGYRGHGHISGLSGSAYIQGTRLTDTVTNPSNDGSIATRIRFAGSKIANGARG